MKWILVIDKGPTTDFDLYTWSFSNMIIQKFYCDDEYAIWMKINDTGNIIKDMKYYGTKPTFKEARDYAEKIYMEVL